MTKPHRLPILLSEKEPLLCSRINAEESVTDYIKDLIRLDMDEPDLLRYEHENTKAMDEDSNPIATGIRLYPGKDDDIIEHLSRRSNVQSYIKGLIYWDMGMNPAGLLPTNRKRGTRTKH